MISGVLQTYAQFGIELFNFDYSYHHRNEYTGGKNTKFETPFHNFNIRINLPVYRNKNIAVINGLIYNYNNVDISSGISFLNKLFIYANRNNLIDEFNGENNYFINMKLSFKISPNVKF